MGDLSERNKERLEKFKNRASIVSKEHKVRRFPSIFINRKEYGDDVEREEKAQANKRRK